jgi:hypothetical protein
MSLSQGMRVRVVDRDGGEDSGVCQQLLLPDGKSIRAHDAPQAMQPRPGGNCTMIAHRLAASPGSNLDEVGEHEDMGTPYAPRLMRLNFLAPVVANLDGRHPIGASRPNHPPGLHGPKIHPCLTKPPRRNIIASIRGRRRWVADIKSESRPASDRNGWPASYWNTWPASSESAPCWSRRYDTAHNLDLSGVSSQHRSHSVVADAEARLRDHRGFSA